MIFKQYYLNCLAHASYLIADEETRIAAVVDPQRDVDRYLEEARHEGVEIRHVFLTHFHADFVAGHLELRDRTGARIHLGATARAEYEFTPMNDGDVLSLGKVLLKIIETPGHTVESISILVYDLTRSSVAAQAVLTGDTLFVGDVGRPDLRASLGWPAAELAGMLYDSLHGKLLRLPDETLMYPAHGAGSLCGRALSQETVSTIGQQRRDNYALQSMGREAFIRLVTADQPDAPAYFNLDAVLNTKERPTLETTLDRVLLPLSLDELLRMKEKGAQVLDTRNPVDFAPAHLGGSLNIGLAGQYATWAGTLLDPERPVVLLAEPGREPEAAMRLGRIGFDNVAGYLRDGILALEERPELTASWNRVDVARLTEYLTSSEPPFLLDVRTPQEWREGKIEGSVNIPLNRLPERIREVPRGKKVLTYCAGGYRSSIASSLLQREGITDLEELAGGFTAWEAARLTQ
jgi:glyoxylase-like metal-dependent hydrolase (beta-lactamase superfamily II)/rhodanese-related sulfurtransferase